MLNSSQIAFLTLCESIVAEDASPIPKALGGGMAAKAITQFVHSKMNLSDKAQLKQLPGKPTWDSVKSVRAWVIFDGEMGFAALRPDSNEIYTVGVVKKGSDSVQTMQHSRMDQINILLKQNVGKIKRYFAVDYIEGASRWSRASDKYDTSQLKRKRAQAKQGIAQTGEISHQTLFKKFKPLFVKAITAAEADIQGIIQNILKTGNYDAAETKIDKLKLLRRAAAAFGPDAAERDTYETQRSKQDITRVLNKATKEAALHFYPDMFDQENITRNPSDEEFDKGVKRLFADIGSGDTKKLGGLLWYFKNGLVR